MTLDERYQHLIDHALLPQVSDGLRAVVKSAFYAGANAAMQTFNELAPDTVSNEEFEAGIATLAEQIHAGNIPPQDQKS